MSSALGLLRLQHVDSRIGQIEARLESIRQILEDDTELVSAQEQLRTAKIAQDSAELTQKKAELEAKSQRGKIQRDESTLYGGSVRNPKELQDLQAEVASLRKHLASIEEVELEAMLHLDVVQQTLQQAQENLLAVELRQKQTHAALLDEQISLTMDRDNLLAERRAATGAINTGLIQTYESLRSLRRGLAVAEVLDQACSACGTVLTAALQQSARHAVDLVHCPSCGRILFAG